LRFYKKNVKKKKMKKNLLFLSFAFLGMTLTACLRLDGNLYNKLKVEKYLFDAYEYPELEKLDASYAIAPDKFLQFTVASDDNGSKANIAAFYLGDTSRIKTDTIILYAHGNKYHLDLYWQRIKMLANMGKKHRFGVLAFDYRGYGMSEGEPTETGMYADADACMQWLKARGLTGDRLVVYGFSLGSACATELTAAPRSLRPSKIILESPFASAAVMGADAAVLNLPGSAVTDLKIDNAEEIKKVQQPFLWLHGTDDDFLRIATHGEVVFKNYKGTKGVAVRVEGGNHSTIPKTMGYKKYMETVLDFITH
jgi:pimeloyl-ACP methyl ester carboxylesterase